MKNPFAVACSLFILLSPTSQAQSFNAKDRPASVVLKPLEFQPLATTIDTIGTAEAEKSVSLFPAASDIVTDIRFTPGDFVEKDQILLTLDNRRQKIALERAKIELRDRKRTLQRLLESQKRGAATQNDVDIAITQRDLARVQLESSQADLEDRRVRAPFSGHVGLTDIEPGDRITTDTLITTIDNRQRLFVNFAAPEAAIAILDASATVTLEPWNDRNTVIKAEVAQLDSRINVADRTLRVRAILDNKDDAYRPGLSFKVTLQLDGQRYPVIPEAALAWGATGAYVWVARDGKAAREPVNIMQRQRGQILVDGAIQESEALVIEGIQRLRNGQNVKDSAMAKQPPQKQGEQG